MKKPDKTQIYYTVNGIHHYDEFKNLIPTNYNELYLEENPNYKGPLNLWQLLKENKEYKFCRDDGPAGIYASKSLSSKVSYAFWQSSKCDNYYWTHCPSTWAKKTNHLLCKQCYKFCNQECFL